MDSEELHGLFDRAQSDHHLSNAEGWVRGEVDFHAEIPRCERNAELTHAAQRVAGHYNVKDSPHLSGRSAHEGPTFSTLFEFVFWLCTIDCHSLK